MRILGPKTNPKRTSQRQGQVKQSSICAKGGFFSHAFAHFVSEGDYEPAWSDPGVELEEDDVSASGLNVAGMSVGAPSTVGTVARNQRLGYR